MERTGVRCGDVITKRSMLFLGIYLALILTGHYHHEKLWTVLPTCLRVAVWTELPDENDSNFTFMGPQYSELPTVFCDGYPLTELMRDSNSICFLVLSYFRTFLHSLCSMLCTCDMLLASRTKGSYNQSLPGRTSVKSWSRISSSCMTTWQRESAKKCQFDHLLTKFIIVMFKLFHVD